jgi:LmbE family N-acetylglucosaminyl deacetylase
MFLLSPHSDDEILFTAYTIMREKPVVIILTFPTLQGDNGNERIMESYKAMKMLGSPVMFLNIPEHEFTEDRLRAELGKLSITDQRVHVPHLDGGHKHHDITHKVATEMFWNISYYRTYGKGETRALGWEVEATDEEKELKQKAMNIYQTQINNPLTAHYFTTLNEYE